MNILELAGFVGLLVLCIGLILYACGALKWSAQYDPEDGKTKPKRWGNLDE